MNTLQHAHAHVCDMFNMVECRKWGREGGGEVKGRKREREGGREGREGEREGGGD